MQKKIDYVRVYIESNLPANKVANLAGVHENTIYNWVGKYEKAAWKGCEKEVVHQYTVPVNILKKQRNLYEA